MSVSPNTEITARAVPFRVEPRLDPKPWGSRGLERFGFPLPPETPIGEALLTAHEARMRDGPVAGVQLGTLVAADPIGLVGRRGLEATANLPLFPLLVKFIDAAENLSIQVHPDDEAAKSVNRLGKTEAWHIVSAAPDAVLFVGLRTGVSISTFIAVCRQGGPTSEYLRRVPAIPGTTILIPAGTVHAIGAGVLLYEVQQPSDVTYRLDDWGRVDAEGRPRELHLDAGLEVTDPDSRPDVIPPVPVGLEGGRRLLAACRYFALEQLVLGTGEEGALELSAPESPQVVTCLQGDVVVTANSTALPLTLGETMIIPAAAGSARIRATVPSVLLRTWVPDLEREVVHPARAMGATDDAITALAGGLPDIARVVKRI